MRLRSVAAYAFLLGFGVFLVRVWPASIPGPTRVDVEFVEELVAADVMHLGANEVRVEAFGVTEQRDVELLPLAGGGQHLRIHGRGGAGGAFEYRYVCELWIEFDDDGDPSARADLRIGNASAEFLEPTLGLDGDVRLSNGIGPRASADVLPLVAYEITGDYGGSPASSSGTVSLR
ncbi:MAG: hypothetical protein HZA52_01330 [Planctomycetes bacterium]|nr:hypothetical protein [Planctomycetota bacterium]